MDTILASRIKRKLQRELIRRKLIQFFEAKGYDNFDLPLYPPSCFDLPYKIPQLYTRCEVVPTVEETDTIIGTVKVSWKLFVLGTNRADLGSTTHVGQTDINRAIAGEPNNQLPAEFVTTPNEIIEFILKVLSNSKAGFVELPPNFQVPLQTPFGPPLQQKGPRSGQFYAK